jgi:putative ABC transport system substrate-binding protein
MLGGAAAWPRAARAQQAATPVVGVLADSRALIDEWRMTLFRQGLGEIGYTEGRNLAIEYRHADGRPDRLPELAVDLIRRKANIIVTPNSTGAALAVKAASKEIPLVFSVTEDPIKLGLVASFPRPAGNATGLYIFTVELGAKRLGLLHELVPAAARIAVLTNPATIDAEPAVRTLLAAAGTIGLQARVINASTSGEIDAAFEALARDRPDAFTAVPNPLFTSRRMQIVLKATHLSLPAIYSNRDFVDAGGLMSYSSNFAEVYRQLGIYTGRILNGTKPADLPVVQPTKFEFVLNLLAAKTIGVDVPATLLAQADEVIE